MSSGSVVRGNQSILNFAVSRPPAQGESPAPELSASKSDGSLLTVDEKEHEEEEEEKGDDTFPRWDRLSVDVLLVLLLLLFVFLMRMVLFFSVLQFILFTLVVTVVVVTQLKT